MPVRTLQIVKVNGRAMNAVIKHHKEILSVESYVSSSVNRDKALNFLLIDICKICEYNGLKR